MKRSTNTNTKNLSRVDVRTDTGLDRNPLDEIKAIQTLLDDVYKDTGDGRTLFRELVQNADDAGAKRLVLTVLEQGWLNAQNSLLRGPALLVANDGPFPKKDRDALHKAIGGSKEDEVGKIGTFGIGLKSVFHICEAFLYVGAENSKWWAGVVSPWSGTGESGVGDPLHPDWGKIDDIDSERLQSTAMELFGNTSNGILFWIPLRQPEHLDRSAEGSQFGLRLHCPKLGDLCAWFGLSTPATLLLAQCGHLQVIDVQRVRKAESLPESEGLTHVGRQEEGWIGRYQKNEESFLGRKFEGQIDSDDRSWTVDGIEAFGSESLQQLRSLPEWPRVPQLQKGLHSSVPRKALAHAAVTVLRPGDLDTKLSAVRLRWAVFLPLADDSEPSSSAIVESSGPSPAWEIILHGYFWPSQDRRSIPGVTNDSSEEPRDDDMRSRWNRELCKELLLPLLPSALANAVARVDESIACRLLDTVVDAKIVNSYLTSIRQRHWLLPVIKADGVQWEALDPKPYRVLSIKKWSQTPEAVRKQFVVHSDKRTDNVVFIDADAPRLADECDNWDEDNLVRLLKCIPDDVFESAQSLRWLEGVIGHILDPNVCSDDSCAAAVAQWLMEKIGDGALRATNRRSSSQEERKKLRETWRDLCKALPEAWLLETPIDCQQAVSKLAAKGVIGEGLFPMPFGLPSEPLPASLLDQKRLHDSLYELGLLPEAGEKSDRLQNSRLLLAERLLSKRHDAPLDERLKVLPILRAIRLPDDRKEAWSIVDLHHHIGNYRVFAAQGSGVLEYDSTDGIQSERSSDPKQAVKELAKALDEPVWMVSDIAVASVEADVPLPTQDTLAEALLRAKALADPESRKPLLNRLAPEASQNDKVCRAARVLLAGCSITGSIKEEGAILFHDRSGNSSTLKILLRLLGRPWCSVQGTLVDSLSQQTLDALSVCQPERESLHRLLDECLNKSVDWTGLKDGEVQQLLQDLYGATHREWELWRKMPLHRRIDGKRETIDDRDRTWRWTKKTQELSLPSKLEEKVLLLDPESQVAHLYDSIPEMDGDSILQLMLKDTHPWHFAERILDRLRCSKGQVILPQGSELRDLLRRSSWLPQRDDDGLAPDAVLIAPNDLLDVAADLAAAGVFGDKRLPEAIDTEIWKKAERAVREILGRLDRERQVQRVVDALNVDQIKEVDNGAWLVMPDSDFVKASLIREALQTTLTDSHRGWKLVHAAARVIERTDGRLQGSSEVLVNLARALCGPIPAKYQIEILTSLSDLRPAKDSHSGHLFREFLESFAKIDEFAAQVLPELHLPTQDGNWHASQDIAITKSGVARRHLLIQELRPILGLTGNKPVHSVNIGDSPDSYDNLEMLERYFEPWRPKIRHGAVGAFLSLLGNGLSNVIEELADQWLGEDPVFEPIEGLDPCAVSVLIQPRVERGDRVNAVNILGSKVEMEAGTTEVTLFAEDPVRRPHSQDPELEPLGRFWEITLRDVMPESRTSSELMQLLSDTVESWACQCLKLDREQVSDWWSRWGKGSQADFLPVLASIKAHLPLTLQQLDVKDNEPLRNALRKAEQAQRKREQAPSDKSLSDESTALKHLAELIEEPEHQTFLWKRVNEIMCRYGYGMDSVLLELTQNADDALAQVAQIKGRQLSPAARRLVIRVHEDGGTPTLDIMHWGRPINDTGGTAFPDGKELQWDHDLYFMMLMNLSGKPGESPGGSSAFSTTGRFGLGFKSIHLISSSPFVVSGFMAFSIAGGLLPQEKAVPVEMDKWTVEGHRPTCVRLPLRSDIDTRDLTEQIFSRFAYARVMLPVFARQLQEVIVEGGSFPGTHTFDGEPIEGAPGWSVGAETKLSNHVGRWRILRFRPADAGRKDMGTTALAIGLREGVPTAFGSDMPFLWNVIPTSENWGCGYVINGPFKLDPGRTHVSLDDDTTVRTACGLGEALGQGLIDLHDLLADSKAALHDALAISDSQGFLSSLWRVLASGLDTSDRLRHSFIGEIHGNGRGLSAWVGSRAVVPSGLPAPFPPMLPCLTSDVLIKVASGSFDNQLCAVLAEIQNEELTTLVNDLCIVSSEVEQFLRPLCALVDTDGACINPVQFCPSDLISELAERWGYLTPERLHSLRPINEVAEQNFGTIDSHGVNWRGKLKARANNGSLQPLRNLLLWDATDVDGEDELLRASFAPDERILNPTYIECEKDWRLFRWLRVEHSADAAAMAEWCMDIPDDRQSAAIKYLLYGEAGFRVLQHLTPTESRPGWLQEYEDVHWVVKDLCKEPGRQKPFLAALFPNQFSAPEPSPTLNQPDTEIFFQRLLEWWDDDTVRSRVIAAYESDVWPEWLRRDGIAASLQANSIDHWLALLILGACQSLGRTNVIQHRSFLDLSARKGWWKVFKAPKEHHAWMGVLRGWQDSAEDKLTYSYWMSLFPTIYQLSRCLNVYVRLLQSAGRRPEDMYQVYRLLAPRIDESLTGAGTHFDAPPAPLNMGLHWVLRELVRMEVVAGKHLFRDCWVPAEQVFRLLGKVGLDKPDDDMSNPEKASAIFDFLAANLGTETPTLHRTFDIPLRYVASNEELRRRFGLEQ